MEKNYLQKARVRSVLYKSEKDKQRLERAVYCRIKIELEILENVKKDLSIIYNLSNGFMHKYSNKLKNIVFESNLSIEEKTKMLKLINDAPHKVREKEIRERKERARKNGYNL